MYIWIKALHVISIIAWMAGLLYLPRLFVYHAGAAAGLQAETFKTMEGRLLAMIMRPAAAFAWMTGLYMAVAARHFHAGWLHAKLGLVILLTGVHGYDEMLAKRFKTDRNIRSPLFYRYYNELPTLLMIGIVILAVVRPF
jgi:protoporphyrinogen IX oxidase